MIRVAVIGYGYWGPNIVRNFLRLDTCAVRWVCDLKAGVLRALAKQYPAISVTTRYEDILTDNAVHAVVIVTPTATHFSLAKRALTAGKHVLVEKPMTYTSSEARALVDFAKSKKKILMVDHTFVYTPAIQKIKDVLVKKMLGDIVYIDCVRTNLGLLQKDANVIYDLATHDISIIDYLLGVLPRSISAYGFHHNQHASQAAVAHITAKYPNNVFFHSHVSWLSPVKVRTMTIVGTKKMLLYDDMEASEKVKIFDTSISVARDPKAIHQLRVGYRIGSIVAPHIPLEEGLFGMAKTFIRAIKTGKPPITDGNAGLRVIRVIEAATDSLRLGGTPVTL